MTKPIYLFFIGLLCFPISIFASGGDERDNQQEFQVRIKRASDAIKVDGNLSETSWKDADIATDFWMSFPTDTEHF